MGKLINRYALFDAIKNITYNRQDADTLFEEVLEIIAEQPTTTEAEIRASAIDEFAEKLKAVCDSIIEEERNHHARPISWAVAYEDFKDDIDDIVVQLKE